MNEPEIDFKYCKKCRHLQRITLRRMCNCLMECFACDKYNDNGYYSIQQKCVYPGIKKHHVQAPRHCPYYAELCVAEWNE